MSKLIINADDFGLHSAINEGIIVGHTKGAITSTSILASGAAFNEAVDMAKEYPKLGIGIHIALVGGIAPVSDPSEIPSLVTNEGVFVDNYIEFMKRIYSGSINYDEVRTEITKQVSKIMESGVNVTHIDGHQHIHVLPSILPIVLEHAMRYKIKAIRVPNEKITFLNGVHNPVRIMGKCGLSTVAAQALPSIRDKGIYFTQYFWGMINGGALGETELLSILEQVSSLSGAHEIMTHPGISNEVLRKQYNWGYHWQDELSAMTSDNVRRYISQHNIELINYGDLL